MPAANTPAAKLSVLVGAKFACVKIAGRANFASSVDFRTLVNELLARQFRYFVLDLSECQLMDSTFLGVLAGFGLKLARSREGEQPGIELLNPNARVAEVLENLGVQHLFKVTHGQLEAVGCTEVESSPEPAPSKATLTEACLEAHQTLMSLNPANVARFKDLALFLAEDLKKLKAGE